MGPPAGRAGSEGKVIVTMTFGERHLGMGHPAYGDIKYPLEDIISEAIRIHVRS